MDCLVIHFLPIIFWLVPHNYFRIENILFELFMICMCLVPCLVVWYNSATMQTTTHTVWTGMLLILPLNRDVLLVTCLFFLTRKKEKPGRQSDDFESQRQSSRHCFVLDAADFPWMLQIGKFPAALIFFNRKGDGWHETWEFSSFVAHARMGVALCLELEILESHLVMKRWAM